MQRNEPFYTLTLFLPILILTVLAPIGLILPGRRHEVLWELCLNFDILVDAGEKMGLQITVLLADVIYVDILQSTVPIFDSLGNTPLILMFFVVSITLLCICLLLTTHTLFLYHCPEYEARNFSRTEARISRAIAKVRFQIYQSFRQRYRIMRENPLEFFF